MEQNQAKKIDIENRLKNLTLIQQKLFLLTLLERLFYSYQKYTKGTYDKVLQHLIENYWDYVITGTKHPCIIMDESDYAEEYQNNYASQDKNDILSKLIEKIHVLLPSLAEDDEVFLIGFGAAFEIIAYFLHNCWEEEQKNHKKNYQSCLEYLKSFSSFVVEHKLYHLEYTREKTDIEYLQKETDLKKIYQRYHFLQKESLFPEYIFSPIKQKSKTLENFYADWIRGTEIIYEKCEEIALNPCSAEIYYDYVKEYIYGFQKDYEKIMAAAKEAIYWKKYTIAIKKLSEAIQKNPDFARPYYKRACVYEQLKEYQNAVEDFTKSIALSPNFAGAYYRRAYSYDKLGEDNKAIDDLTKTILLKPYFAEAYSNRSHSYNKIGEYQKALADCKKAEAMNPNLSSIYYNRGNSYYHLEEYQKAILNYEIVLAQISRDIETNFYQKAAHLCRKKIIRLLKKSFQQKK